MDRIYFQDSNDRLKFFNEAKLDSGMNSWKQLAKYIKTSRSMLDKYRYGILCMPYDRFQTLLHLINDEDQGYFSVVVKRRNENWGQVVGGKRAYVLNKASFDLGRRLPKRFDRPPKYWFDVDMPLSEDLCEFVGVIIGDGFTNRYGRVGQIQLTGDRKLDRDYYYNVLKKICERLFNISPRIFVREKNNSIRLNIYSNLLFKMLTTRFGIPPGKKAHKIVIPDEILNAGKNLLNATLRGMFNADGGVGFDKRPIYKRPYVRINYTSVSFEPYQTIARYIG